jgi:hypothetical protein
MRKPFRLGSGVKSVLAATAIATVLALQPGSVSAQTTSCCTKTSVFFRYNMNVGYEHFTWFTKLWHAPDGSVSLWHEVAGFTADPGHPDCNPADGITDDPCSPGEAKGSVNYGPYAGWSPIAIASSIGTNNTYLLWHHTSGYTSIWLLDVNLNYVTSYVIPPMAGWTADGLTINASSNRVQVSWTHSTGVYATWEFDPLLTSAVGGPSYGPYPPWSPGPTE